MAQKTRSPRLRVTNLMCTLEDLTSAKDPGMKRTKASSEEGILPVVVWITKHRRVYKDTQYTPVSVSMTVTGAGKRRVA